MLLKDAETAPGQPGWKTMRGPQHGAGEGPTGGLGETESGAASKRCEEHHPKPEPRCKGARARAPRPRRPKPLWKPLLEALLLAKEKKGGGVIK